jgi:alpha-beta hydrolase superfamily lysophospholipase
MNVNISDGYFKTKESINIYWKKWLPENRKATVIIVHGVLEHIDRYINVVNALLPENIAIYGTTHQGHGKSEGHRAYIKNILDYVEETRTFYTNIVQNEAENKPIFILGHSMGSIISMLYASNYQDGLKGIMLSGTGLNTSGVAGILKFGAIILSAIAPKGALEFPLPVEFISSDEREVQKYRDDPYCGGKISFRLGNEIERGLKLAVNRVNKITIPTLIQYGKDDIAFKNREELLERFSSTDKTLKGYDNC